PAVADSQAVADSRGVADGGGEPASAGEAGEPVRAEVGSPCQPQSPQRGTPSALAIQIDPQPGHRSSVADQPSQAGPRWQIGQTITCSPAAMTRRQGLAPLAGSVWRTPQHAHGMTTHSPPMSQSPDVTVPRTKPATGPRERPASQRRERLQVL